MAEKSDLLKREWFSALLRFKSVITCLFTSSRFSLGSDITMMELFMLKEMESNSPCGANNIYMSDVQKNLLITKAAVSKTLSGLEKKGYVVREVDRKNRRHTIVTLTQAGKDLVKLADKNADRTITKIIDFMGENEVEKFIADIIRLADKFDVIIQNSGKETDNADFTG